MSLGLRMAAEALGNEFVPELAADFEAAALGIYEENLKPRRVFVEDLSHVIDFTLASGGDRFALGQNSSTIAFDRL